MKPSPLRVLRAFLRASSSNHVNDYFQVWKATDGNWYGQAFYYDAPYEEDTWGSSVDYDYLPEGPAWGPFDSEYETSRYLHRKYANRGQHSDDSGRKPPPKKPVSPKSW